MNNLQTNLCNLLLKNPLLPGSGPHTGDFERMLFLAENQKLGAIVSKTIAPEAANVQRPCIIGGNGYIMNCELWSEFDHEVWANDFLKNFKERSNTPMIANIGYTIEDLKIIIPKIDKLVDGYEINPRYASLDYSKIGESVLEVCKLTDKPFWVKMNGAAFANPVEYAKVCFGNGAKGVIAATAIGPNMSIDLEKRCPTIGTTTGYVWTSGPNIKPYTIAMIHMIKTAIPEISIIGTGGVSSAEDVVAYLLAGADAVEMLSAAMLYGRTHYAKVIADLPKVLEKYGFSSIEEVKATQITLPKENFEPSVPIISEDKCKKCDLCIKNCPYFSMEKSNEGFPVIDKEKCFGCGLCQSRCPVKAITNVIK